MPWYCAWNNVFRRPDRRTTALSSCRLRHIEGRSASCLLVMEPQAKRQRTYRPLAGGLQQKHRRRRRACLRLRAHVAPKVRCDGGALRPAQPAGPRQPTRPHPPSTCARMLRSAKSHSPERAPWYCRHLGSGQDSQTTPGLQHTANLAGGRAYSPNQTAYRSILAGERPPSA